MKLQVEQQKKSYNNGAIYFKAFEKDYKFTHARYTNLDLDADNNKRKHKLENETKVKAGDIVIFDSGTIDLPLDPDKGPYNIRITLLSEQGQVSARHSDWVAREDVVDPVWDRKKYTPEERIESWKKIRDRGNDFWNKKIKEEEAKLLTSKTTKA